MKKVLAIVSGSALALAALAGAPPASGTSAPPSAEPTVVASGLNNPRQLSFSKSGALYVAEAGSGGTESCMAGPEGGVVCYGLSGSVTKVWRGKQRRVLTRLPSIGAEGTGEQASGPSDVIARGNKLIVSLGLGAPPAVRDTLPKSAKRLGTVQKFSWKHKSRTVADLAAYEAAANPIHDPDSNPTSVVPTRWGFVSTDAGGNTLLRIGKRGHVSTIAVFPDVAEVPNPFDPTAPNISVQAVPTDVTRGPDGAYYVTQLTGFPFQEGLANIYRVVPGSAPTVYASGLTNVTSLAFSRDGSLYAVELSSEGLLNGPIGSLVKVAPDGSGGTHEVIAGGLFAPYGLALHKGAAYVTTGSVAPGAGQVIRVPLGT